MATKTRRVIRDPDSDTDSETFSTPVTTPLPKSTTAAPRKMEFLESHHAPTLPKVQAARKDREIVDLTNSPPVSSHRGVHTSSSTSSHSSGRSQSHVSYGTHGSQGLKKHNQPLAPSHSSNRPFTIDDFDRPFGSSVITAKKGKSTSGFGSAIKPATPNAFKSYGNNASSSQSSHFYRPSSVDPGRPFKPTVAGGSTGNTGSWPAWLVDGRPTPFVNTSGATPLPVSEVGKNSSKTTVDDDDYVEREVFDINVGATAEDYERHNGDADEHMRELLSGAIGDGEGEMGDDGMEDGDDVIEGFAKGIRLMPHQVRGTKWMKGRESGRKYGGILADVICSFPFDHREADKQDMGLGKTVQTLARIVDGKATAAEKKAGHKGGTLWV